MADIIYFKPRAELDAECNMQGFIALCRNELTVFGSDLPFDSNTWDITDYIGIKGHGNVRHGIVFSTLKTVNDRFPTAMPEKFLIFAKSYMRYLHGIHPIVDYKKRLVALRAVCDALSSNSVFPDPVEIDSFVLNKASQMVREKYSGVVAYRVGGHLQFLSQFLIANRLTIRPFPWRNFLKRPCDTDRVGKEFDKRRQSKLPSEAALESLPKVFLLAVEPVDVIVASVAVILISCPDRISEVLTLPENCEVDLKRENGEADAYGLRWWPAKAANPTVKWILPSWASVVKEAISRIKKITAEARRIAIWYEINPGRIYLSEDREYLRGQEWLSLTEVAAVIGMKRISSASHWCSDHKIKRNISKQVKFADVQNAVLSMLPRRFPILEAETGLKYSEALLICRKNEIDESKATYNCMIEPISINQINNGLGSQSAQGKSSIYSRAGFCEPDGTPIRITTHQFRHYLNTLAQMGGLSQLDIAKWSGRQDVRQNAAYDHETAEQMLMKIRDAIGDDSQFFGPLGSLAEISKGILIPRDEFSRLVAPTAHTTDLGYCLHDYTMSPCQIFRDCIHCGELVFLKGDEEKAERLRKGLAEARELTERAEKKVGEGYAGSDRWFEHHRSTLERLQQVVSIMDDPKVPVGSVIQLTPPKSAKLLNESLKLYKTQDAIETMEADDAQAS
jgi:hypothetical protein